MVNMCGFLYAGRFYLTVGVLNQSHFARNLNGSSALTLMLAAVTTLTGLTNAAAIIDELAQQIYVLVVNNMTMWLDAMHACFLAAMP